jgi:hypothetical protein
MRVVSLAVGCTGSGEVRSRSSKLKTEVDDLLFSVEDSLVELADVVGRAEPGIAPGVLAE